VYAVVTVGSVDEVTRLQVPARLKLVPVAGAGLAAAFAVLAALHVDGRLAALDRYAVEHWMPGLDASPDSRTWPAITGLFRPFSLDAPAWEKAVGLVTYPASVLISLLAFALACRALVRRGRHVAALVWGCSWFVANAVEVLLKWSLSRPPLYGAGEDGRIHHLRGFDHAFPSGHTLRALMVAGLLVYVWGRVASPAVVWALLVPPLLVVAGDHVPADVIAGLVFGLLVVLVTAALATVLRLPFLSRAP
jgi:membrane-associated phospholipid phosphatase